MSEPKLGPEDYSNCIQVHSLSLALLHNKKLIVCQRCPYSGKQLATFNGKLLVANDRCEHSPLVNELVGALLSVKADLDKVVKERAF